MSWKIAESSTHRATVVGIKMSANIRRVLVSTPPKVFQSFFAARSHKYGNIAIAKVWPSMMCGRLPMVLASSKFPNQPAFVNDCNKAVLRSRRRAPQTIPSSNGAANAANRAISVAWLRARSQSCKE